MKVPLKPSLEEIAVVGNDDEASERNAQEIVTAINSKSDVFKDAEQSLQTVVTAIAVLMQKSGEEALETLLT